MLIHTTEDGSVLIKSATWMQCELFHRAKIAGLTPSVEIRMISKHHRSRTFRVDVFLMREGRGVLVCECKQDGALDSWEGLKTRQARAYADCGLPAMLIKSEADIDAAILRALAL